MLSRYCLKKRTDESLIASTKTLVAKQSQLTAELLAHIAEVEARKLHVKLAYPSMFQFCVDALGLSEPMTYKYIGVARAARQYEAIFPMVAAGELHLSAAIKLVPHLTDDNSDDLLQAAAGKSKRQVEQIIAQRFPKPDAPSQIRKLPNRAPGSNSSQPQQSSSQAEIPTKAPVSEPAGATDVELSTEERATSTSTPSPSDALAPSSGLDGRTGTGSSSDDDHAAVAGATPTNRPPIEPLSAARYKVQFTASEQLRRKLEQAQELLRRQVPDGDLASICERAIDLLLESLVKKRFALGTKTRGKAKRRQGRSSPAASQKPHRDSEGDRAATATVADEASSGEPESVSSMEGQEQSAAGNGDKHGGGNRKQARAKRSRYIPAAVRRQVAKRDGLRCTYVGPDGHRCQCRDVDCDEPSGEEPNSNMEWAQLGPPGAKPRLAHFGRGFAEGRVGTSEFHHVTPFARGGEHKAEEIMLRCRVHNAYQAELDYGVNHIKRRIHQQRARSAQRRAEPGRPAQPMVDAAR